MVQTPGFSVGYIYHTYYEQDYFEILVLFNTLVFQYAIEGFFQKQVYTVTSVEATTG